MVINEFGAAKIALGFEWEKEATKRGLRNPFDVSLNLFKKRRSYKTDENGRTIGILRPPTEEDALAEPSIEEKEEYMRQRNEWFVEEAFKEYGWDYAIYMAKTSTVDYSYVLERLRPCESADGQCRFDCKEFGLCPVAMSDGE